MVEGLGRIGFGLFGLAVLIGIAWLFSNNKRSVDWRLVITGITLQFGTESALEVLQAMRAEQWLHLHPEAPPMLADQIRAQIRAAFYDDTDAWKGQVISQARQALFQAVDGLIS